ncbi:MAG: sialidase [Pseudomonadota bacterium]
MRTAVSHLLATLIVVLTFSVSAQTLTTEQMEPLKFRHIGPVGNRLISVTGIPGDPLTYYVGAASGGIWKSTDGGLNWKPVFDGERVHSIGALALAPSEPEVIYAGTGEAFIRSNVSIGNGVWKSTDGGESWTHLGLKNTGRISRIVVHPSNPDLVYVAALGHGYTPQEERGIYKSTDGGASWSLVLHVDEDTGASDLIMDPFNPRILFAGLWSLELRPWTRNSGGVGSGIYKSLDAGETWTRLEGNGLPEGNIGKVSLSMTAAQQGRLYALIETGDGIPLNDEPTNTGELWRSEDRGGSFTLINSDRDLTGRGAYYTRSAASPDNPNEIYFFSAAYATSIDGGKTAVAAAQGKAPNWDHHEMWIDPTDGDRQIVVGDGGLSISHNRGKSWLRVHLPVAQLYHVTTDTEVPYNVLTNRQDGPSMKGPSRSRSGSFFGSFIGSGLWHDVGGGESGFATADPTDPNIVWSSASGFGALGGVVVRYDDRSKQFRQVEVWPEWTAGMPAADVKYRFQWTFPLLISPHDNNTVYVASQFVHRTTNGGQSWEIVSPDLTLNDPSKQQFSGGLTGDNIGVEYANVVYALEESPVEQGLLWAGTNDGLVHVSRDNGANWTNVSSKIPGMPDYGAVRNIEASKHDAATAYITVDAHEMGDFEPYVYVTTNYGRSWKKITSGIDDGVLSYARMVKEDPFNPNVLYLGTENALYFSLDKGRQWQSLMTNLPSSPMYWMDIPEHFNDLVVGTYGRGVWILDDLTPIQQFSDEVAESSLHLFDPKDAYRLHPISSVMQFFPEASSGEDPQAGTTLHYWQSEETEEEVSLVISNSAGETIRTIEHEGKLGINRVWWDFKEDATTAVVMRTKPLYADWLPLKEDRTRPPTVPPISLMASPGTYTVTLKAGDLEQSQSFEVMKDPNSTGTIADITEQKSLLDRIRADYEAMSVAVNETERVRRQLRDLMAMVDEPTKEAVEALDGEVTALENRIVQLKHTGKGQDQIRTPGMLMEKLGYLASTIAIGDFRPADQYVAVYEELQAEWLEVSESWSVLKDGAVAELRDQLIEDQQAPLVISVESDAN